MSLEGFWGEPIGHVCNRSTYFFIVVEVSECFWTVPGQSGAKLPIFICP